MHWGIQSSLFLYFLVSIGNTVVSDSLLAVHSYGHKSSGYPRNCRFIGDIADFWDGDNSSDFPELSNDKEHDYK